jgi:serine/threonine protein kinase
MSRVLFTACITTMAVTSIPLQASPENARVIARTLWEKDHNIGLKLHQLERVCLFIDKMASQRGGRRLFPKSRTHLLCDIERTTSPKGFMLTHLPGPYARIGGGVHKVVMKALFYGDKPKIVAECLCDESGAGEIAVLKRLQGSRGIVPYLGSKARPRNRYTIYLEYICGGSLTKNIRAHYPFTTQQKLKIATDVMVGLHSMHRHHLVHRDLHGGNILLRKNSSGLVNAVLTDFGKTIAPREATDEHVPQAPKTRNPPETLIQRFSTIDRYAADVYAVGCNFFLMEWKKPVPWATLYNVYKLHAYTPQKRAKMHRRIARQYEKLKKEKIGDLLAKRSCGVRLTAIEQFRVLIFEMLTVAPKRRPSVKAVLNLLQDATSPTQCLTAASTDPDSSSQTKSAQGMLWSALHAPLQPLRSFSPR